MKQMLNKYVWATVVAGLLLVCTSFLPWLVDPINGNITAWNIPIDLGEQFHVGFVNYGLLCLCCTLSVLLVALAAWRPFRGSRYFAGRYGTAALVCLLPLVLLLWQFLFSDVSSINLLAQHKVQQLFIQQQFGYGVAPERISVSPLLLDTATLSGRAALLLDQLSIGPVLSLLSVFLLLAVRRFVPKPSGVRVVKRRTGLVVAGGVLLLIVLGRAPLAMVCENQASNALTMGSYGTALNWLSAAVILNPALNDAASYHIERGQALYYMKYDQQSADSRAYIAATYRVEGDYLDAYAQFLPVWQAQQRTPWVVDELSTTLERLAEYIQPLHGPPVRRPAHNDTALPWVQLLIQVDPNTVYGRYLVGRIQYDLHNYAVSEAQMNVVLHLTANRDIQSSAYTYIALNAAGQGDYVNERALLLKAVQLDPNYHNNTAREDLSGLR